MDSEAESHGKLVRSFAAIGTSTVILAGFGLVRESVVALKFGASSELDAFVLSFSIIYFFPVLLTTTLQGTFIPSFHRTVQDNPERGTRLGNITLNALVFCLLFCAMFLFIFGKALISALAPGFPDTGRILAFSLLLSLFPTLLLNGINEQLKNMLNAVKIFGFPSFTQILPSLTTIISIVTTYHSYGIYSFVIGWNVGMLAQSFALIWCWKRNGGTYQVSFDPQFPEFRTMLRESVPYLVVPLVTNGLLFVDRYFASLLGPGTISYFNYGDKLFRIPWMIIATALFTAALPFFSERAAKKDVTKLRDSISLTLRLVAFLTIPVASGIVILRKPLITAIFQRGAFTAEDTAGTSIVVVGFMASMFFYALNSILDRAHCSLGNTKSLMKLATLTMIVKIFFAWIMTRMWGLWGLSFSSVPALLLQSCLMYLLLIRTVGTLEIRELAASVGKVLGATLLMTILILLAQWTEEYAISWFSLQIPAFLVLIVTIFLGTTVFWFASLRLRSREALILLDILSHMRK